MILALVLLVASVRACAPDECTPAPGSCVLSTPSVLCAECSYRGFLSSGQCECVLPYFDPATACAPVFSYATSINLATVTSRVTCTAFQNERGGFYAQPDYDAFTYGDPNPPMPDVCLRSVWGPAPNQVIDSLLPGTTIQTCNTFGGPNPDSVNDTSFVTCSGHGFWSATAYRCDPCYDGWMLADTGIQGVGGNTAKVCSQCAPFRGPSTGLGPFCVSVWTPNNVTGVGEMCGGRGQMTSGGCECFGNGTLGTVSGTFGVLQYTAVTGTATTLASVTVSAVTCL